MPQPHWELFCLADPLDVKTRSPCQCHQSISKTHSNAKTTIPKNTTDPTANAARFFRSARLSISPLTITTRHNTIISINIILITKRKSRTLLSRTDRMLDPSWSARMGKGDPISRRRFENDRIRHITFFGFGSTVFQKSSSRAEAFNSIDCNYRVENLFLSV
jgi:hypothetical protein